jgi:nitrogenase molybdenum-iron protein alpha chain
MRIDLRPGEPPTREQRLGSITGYDGRLTDLADKGRCGCLREKKRCFSTVNYCSHMTAINSVLALPDTLVVDHAPVGCAGVYMLFGGAYDLNVPSADGEYRAQARMISTRLTERDTIFGAEEKLRDTVRAAAERHNPREIYIATSCVSAIIGEDVNTVATELSRELGVPVIMLSAEGLRSRLWATGFDAYYHSVLKARVGPPAKKTDSIIYSGFASVAVEEIRPVFARFGLDVICMTGGGSIEEFARASSAVCSFGQCDVEADYALNYLDQQYGVKYFHVHQPNGGIGFDRFMRELGDFLGKRDVAESVIADERAKYEEKIDGLRPFLKRKRALVALGAGYVFEAVRMLGELGMEAVHAVAYHYDPASGDGSDPRRLPALADIEELGVDVDASVNNAQELETYLVIKKYRPDIVITRAHGAGSWAARVGTPCLDMGLGLNIVGYRGLYLFASALAATLRNTNFFDKLGARYVSPFTEKFETLGPYRFYEEGGGA